MPMLTKCQFIFLLPQALRTEDHVVLFCGRLQNEHNPEQLVTDAAQMREVQTLRVWYGIVSDVGMAEQWCSLHEELHFW